MKLTIPINGLKVTIEGDTITTEQVEAILNGVRKATEVQVSGAMQMSGRDLLLNLERFRGGNTTYGPGGEVVTTLAQ